MFARFESHFHKDIALSQSQNGRTIVDTIKPPLRELLLRFGGASFNNGLYRVMTPEVALLCDAFVTDAFPDFAARVAGFAYDWLGRIFALGSARNGGREPVLMFEPGTGHVLEICCDLATFYDKELIDHGEEALAIGFYNLWLANGGIAPRADQCIAYRKHLFLGGKDAVENLEVADLNVYWAISGQLVQQTHGLPIGTRVRKAGVV